MSQKKAILSRRNFLFTVGAGGAVTAAAVIGGKATVPSAAKADKRAGESYKVSAHIKNYYRTTKV